MVTNQFHDSELKRNQQVMREDQMSLAEQAISSFRSSTKYEVHALVTLFIHSSKIPSHWAHNCGLSPGPTPPALPEVLSQRTPLHTQIYLRSPGVRKGPHSPTSWFIQMNSWRSRRAESCLVVQASTQVRTGTRAETS